MGPRWAVSAAFFAFGTVAGSLVPRMPAFKESLHLTDGQVGLAFVVYAVDATSADGHNRRLRRLVRSAFWMRALTGYMRDEDSIKIACDKAVNRWIHQEA